MFHVEPMGLGPARHPGRLYTGEEGLGTGLLHQFQESPQMVRVQLRRQIVQQQEALPACGLVQIGGLGQEQSPCQHFLLAPGDLLLSREATDLDSYFRPVGSGSG